MALLPENFLRHARPVPLLLEMAAAVAKSWKLLYSIRVSFAGGNGRRSAAISGGKRNARPVVT